MPTERASAPASAAADPVGQSPAPKALDAAVALLSATAHPVRLSVLLCLSRVGPQSVGQLCDTLDVEQSALSHQLRVLRDARLVRGRRRGKRVFYELVDHHVAHIVEDALSHVSEGTGDPDSCAAPERGGAGR